MQNNVFSNDFTIGILGGGQLGKMMIQEASKWHMKTFVLDKDPSMSAGPICNQFFKGDFNNYDDVYNFGKKVDVLTIEIEHVNIKALHALEKEGVTIHPSPKALEIIKDKGAQKMFYEEKGLPTSKFSMYENKYQIEKALEFGELTYPFVQKSRLAGYDGNGVAVIKSEADKSKILDTTSIIEPLVDIEKEISVIVARNPDGDIKHFTVSEMVFRVEKNLVDYIYTPARIDEGVANKAIEIAHSVIAKFDMCGLLAVEFFLTKDGELLINEVAPRPHNSGHHTMDNCTLSQYEQHLRAITNLPLGITTELCPAMMINILGEDGYDGDAVYKGIEDVLALEGTSIHLYGKEKTRSFRKMGHINILGTDFVSILEKSIIVKNSLKVIAK